MFSFYQKIWSVIAAAVIGVTVAIAFVCIDEPYTKWFGIGLAAIVLAEVLAFGSWIRVLGAKDRNLPFNMGYVYPWWLYFLFALLMTAAAAGHMKISYFLLIHAIGLVAAGIFVLVMAMGEHNINEQDKTAASERAGKRQLKSATAELCDLILAKFAGDPDMRKVAEKVSDLGAYAPNSVKGCEDADEKLLDRMDALKAQLDTNCTPAEIADAVNALARAFARRNELVKDLR